MRTADEQKAKKDEVKARLVSMMTDEKHGDAASQEEAEWLIASHRDFSDAELAQAIGAVAVQNFRKLADFINFA